jgi:hypothetical protein
VSLLKPISYEGVAAFVAQSGLKVPHVAELFDKYLQLDTDENDEIGVDGVFALLQGVFAQYEEHFCTAVFNFVDQQSGQRGRVHPAKVRSMHSPQRVDSPLTLNQKRSSVRSICSARARPTTRRASSFPPLTPTTASRSTRPSSVRRSKNRIFRPDTRK